MPRPSRARDALPPLNDANVAVLNEVVLTRLEELRLLTVKQVADILARSERTVVRLIDRGELPHVRMGRSVLVKMIDVRRLIDRNTHGST